MENFVLYHEIYKRDGMTMYKGRKKGTITYVAIWCMEKSERIKVTNHVRLVYEMEHSQVVKFHEWYETSNHLWLVTELCVGGTLAQILQQDIRLPVPAVRIFGCQLMRGLHHLHMNDLIYGAWNPSKLILAGDGSLKFFDFSEARKMDEDPQDLVQRFFSTLNLEQSELDELFTNKPVCSYSAPECIQGSPLSFAADVWGLGCILFEMLAGVPPFSGEDPQELSQAIINNPAIVPRAHSASAELADLLQQMLNKQPSARPSLAEICEHPFWEGCLADLARPTVSLQGSVQTRTPHVPVSSTVSDDASSSTVDDVSFTLHLGSRTSAHQTGLLPPCSTQTEMPNSDPDQEPLLAIAMASSASEPASVRARSDEYLKMAKDGRLKYDSKLLPVPPYTTVKWRSLRRPDRERHLKQIDSLLRGGEKGPPSQRRLHLLNYLGQLCLSPEISGQIIESGLALELCRQLRSSSGQEMLCRLCQLLAIICHHCGNGAGQEEAAAFFAEAVVTFSEVLRDQFRCPRVKLPCVTALGEALVRLAQDGTEGGGLAVTLLNRCLHRTEEAAVSLAAARAIEAAVERPASPVTILLATAETAQQLYGSYRHASTDQLKTAAISALCGLCRVDGGLFAGLLDKIGPLSLLDGLHLALIAVQERVLEMFLLAVLAHPAALRRLSQDGGFLSSAMRLLETTSAVVRAKTLLLVLLLTQADVALLRVATDHRLVLHLEREARRAPEDVAMVSSRCLGLLSAFLTECAMPAILADCGAALASVQGRKHPSSTQAKALRRALPLLESAVTVVASPLLRASVLAGPEFLSSIESLLTHARLVDAGQTSIGADLTPPFLSNVLALAEAACHCPEAPRLLLPSLARLTHSASTADLRIISLKLCADLVSRADPETPPEPLLEAVQASLLPLAAQLLADPDPSAACLLRLLRHALSLGNSLLPALRDCGLPSLLAQLLGDHQTRVQAAAVLETLNLVRAAPSLHRDLVLEPDFVPVLCETLLELGDHFHRDEGGQRPARTAAALLCAVGALSGLARLVAEVVRAALAAKRRGGDEAETARLTEEAETLLGAARPLTDTVDLLACSVGSEGADSEVGEAAATLLNQVVSLFGGQQLRAGARAANLGSLCAAVAKASTGQRRTLLRVLKRLLACAVPPVEGAATVRSMVVALAPVCKREGDLAGQALLDEISRCLVEA